MKNEKMKEDSSVLTEMAGKGDGFAGKAGAFEDLKEDGACRSSSSSESMAATGDEERSNCCSSEESSSSFCSSATPQSTISGTPHLGNGDMKQGRQGSPLPEIEMMKERFAKLLLGEDMSGCGNGVSTALAISNAITNLCATLFGQVWRLEPLAIEKKRMWRREMEWILCVSDHIVEMIPTWQTFPDGTKLEIMTCRSRSDLHVNLPALRKLDNMLLEVLDSFRDTEFWYVDKGIVTSESADGSCSFRRQLQRQEEKWWLPVPCVPAGGLREDTQKQLQHKRDCTSQIFKAAMAINTVTLADMDVPHSFMDTLPKNGRASLGDLVYRYITSEQFSAECLLDCLDLSSEHQAIEIANRVEASIYLWRQTKPSNGGRRRSASRSSWDMVKELVMDVDKREVLADRAESLLLCLKRRFPGLPQTTLDVTKIQCNKDVGKSILESYSRVLESLAFNIMARIDDILYVDDMTKHSDQFSPISRVSVIAHKTVSIPYASSATPFKTSITIQGFSPSKGERSPFLSSSGKLLNRGAGVKKVLTDYLNINTTRVKEHGSPNYAGASATAQVERSESMLSTTRELSVTSSRIRSAEPSNEACN